ncbi:MAG: dihydrolipoamide acetyltransferase family protein [Truepera sp.]|nr:dihydrolipoamide acetyltransferase family protein [Truepera sp.]
MPREFLLPKLAESIIEGEIVTWLVEEGEGVELDQPIVEVMTDKVTVELPSPFAGTLVKRLAAEGDVVAVNHPIALFSDPDESTPSEGTQVREEPPGAEVSASEADDGLSLFAPSEKVDDRPVVQVSSTHGAVTERTAARPTGPYGRVLAVPAARKLARELGISIDAVTGSGSNGRIGVVDVQAHARAAGRSAPYISPAEYPELEERVPFSGLRRSVASQMLASHLQTVRTLHVDEADVSELVRMRARLKPVAAERGVRLTYLPFVMKAVVSALRAFPSVNSSLDEEAGEIVLKRYVNLSVAVATDGGLMVPVIHDVDRKGLHEVAAELQDKAERAREGKLAPEDVRGGTFSITNVGTLGGLFSFPIINLPEAAILGVHSIKRRPVVLEDDSIQARSMLYLSLSFDHRLIDGAEATGFTGQLIDLLENPERLLLES